MDRWSGAGTPTSKRAPSSSASVGQSSRGGKLLVYLVVSPQAVSAVLLAERESVQVSVYFVSHVLKDTEYRYSLVEKFGMALLMANRKLRPYFLAHSILDYTDHPLKQVLQKKWVPLGECSNGKWSWTCSTWRLSLEKQPRARLDWFHRISDSVEGDTLRTVFWEVKPKKSIEQEQVLFLNREQVWMDPIIEFKKTCRLPADPVKAKYVKAMDEWFELWDKTLYKKAFNRSLLKCINNEDGLEVMKELHDGACASHIGGRALWEKTLRTGYYWLTLKEDYLTYAKKCDSYKKHGNIHQKPSNYLTPILFLLPFAKWGMNILGPFPVAVRQKKFVLVVVDYFTKWVEAEAMRENASFRKTS